MIKAKKITYIVYGRNKKLSIKEEEVTSKEFLNVAYEYDAIDSNDYVKLAGLVDNEIDGPRNADDSELEKSGYYTIFETGIGQKTLNTENNTLIGKIESTDDMQGIHKKLCDDKGYKYTKHKLIFEY